MHLFSLTLQAVVDSEVAANYEESDRGSLLNLCFKFSHFRTAFTEVVIEPHKAQCAHVRVVL